MNSRHSSFLAQKAIMTRIMITVSEDEKKALCALAENEYRDPRQQAALLIREELQRRGLLAVDRESVSQQNFPAVEREPV
jgi:hypothetical protein